MPGTNHRHYSHNWWILKYGLHDSGASTSCQVKVTISTTQPYCNSVKTHPVSQMVLLSEAEFKEESNDFNIKCTMIRKRVQLIGTQTETELGKKEFLKLNN